jgi:hypothetical protein
MTELPRALMHAYQPEPEPGPKNDYYYTPSESRLKKMKAMIDRWTELLRQRNPDAHAFIMAHPRKAYVEYEDDPSSNYLPFIDQMELRRQHGVVYDRAGNPKDLEWGEYEWHEKVYINVQQILAKAADQKDATFYALHKEAQEDLAISQANYRAAKTNDRRAGIPGVAPIPQTGREELRWVEDRRGEKLRRGGAPSNALLENIANLPLNRANRTHEFFSGIMDLRAETNPSVYGEVLYVAFCFYSLCKTEDANGKEVYFGPAANAFIVYLMASLPALIVDASELSLKRLGFFIEGQDQFHHRSGDYRVTQRFINLIPRTHPESLSPQESIYPLQRLKAEGHVVTLEEEILELLLNPETGRFAKYADAALPWDPHKVKVSAGGAPKTAKRGIAVAAAVAIFGALAAAASSL